MKRLCLLLMLWVIPLYADTPPTTAPGIRLPDIPLITPVVTPDFEPVRPRAAAADVIHKITSDVIYVFDTDVECVVTSSQLGLVTITSEPGPLRIRGKFVDDPTKIVTKNFKGKTVYTLEPLKTGRIELIVIPIGAKTESDLIRRTLDVDTGVAPTPDPKPPGPKPIDPPPTPTKELRVLFVYESSSNLTREQLNILNSLKIKQYLDSHCVKDGATMGYRFWDKDVDAGKDIPVWRDIWAATKPSIGKLPTVVIFSGTEGKNYPLPETEDAMMKLLIQYGGK